jgi:hypothetical protein
MNQSHNLAPVILLVSIVDRSKEDLVVQVCTGLGVHFHLMVLGTGTASSEVLDCLGLGETDKSVVMSLVTEKHVPTLRTALVNQLQMRSPGKGILFTVPLKALTGQLARQLSAQERKGDELPMEQPTSEYGLILTLVNSGYSEDVMAAAREAGATGGTLVHARRLGSGESSQFLGITLQQERELVAILAKEDVRHSIMKTLAAHVGMGTPAQGVVLSLPVTCIDGLR